MMQFAPIDETNKTLATRVHERLREAILTRTLKPGARLDQNQIAEYLNVSLAPVREALKGLEAEGLVTILPRRGAFVAEISTTDLDELYFTRALIEGETIYHAVPHMTQQHIADLQQLINRMRQATAAGDINTYISLNREFHLGIYTCLNNQLLLQLIHNLWKRSELYRYRYMFIKHDVERVHQEHQAILDACAQGDQAAARAAAALHIQRTQQELHDVLRADLEASNNENPFAKLSL
jgi:DNA-binding GntR family transcriptional regulator